MKVSDFDYELPERLIAQTRLKSAMNQDFGCSQENESIEHRVSKDIIEYLNPGDCLVINDTKVIPARLLGKRKDTAERWNLFS